jgi:hypothetical protein
MFIYYIDKVKFVIDDYNKIPFNEISSPDEQTPAYENLTTGEKVWCLKGDFWHRLTGPTRIWPDGKEDFCLNGKRYYNIKEWLKDHPNQDNAFQVEMLLKYT